MPHWLSSDEETSDEDDLRHRQRVSAAESMASNPLNRSHDALLHLPSNISRDHREHRNRRSSHGYCFFFLSLY